MFLIFFQVSSALNDLDSFLKRIEPGVEAITGEERDIFSFMRLMRIFNEVNEYTYFPMNTFRDISCTHGMLFHLKFHRPLKVIV